MQTTLSINHIAHNQQVRNGRPHIIGTTVTVTDVAIAKIYHHEDADGIAAWYGLTLAQVYAALSYYYDHKADLDEQIRRQIQEAQDLKARRAGNERSLLSR